MRQLLKQWMLPISILGGLIFHNYVGYLEFLTPYLIFASLIVTYCRVKPREFKFTKFHLMLLLIQLAGCWIAYFVTAWINPYIGQGAFICVFISTATAAPVITGMLGGSISRLVSYSLLSNCTLAILAPLFLSLISDRAEIPFIESVSKICAEVFPLLIMPIIIALILRYTAPKIHAKIENHQSLSFYIWAVALFIVVGNSVKFVIKQPDREIPEMIGLALASLVVCCLQFYAGRMVGKRYGDPVAGAQGLGQKNTILAIWMALTYLNPIASIAPAAYVGWQNIINSLQIYYKSKREII